MTTARTPDWLREAMVSILIFGAAFGAAVLGGTW